MRRTPIMCACLVSLACLPDPQPVTWGALDMEGLRESIQAPTGVVTEATSTEAASLIVEDREAFRVVSTYIDKVFVSGGSGDAATPWIIPQALGGTSVYALRACPGEDPDAEDVAWAHGSLRIDSPNLTQEIIENLEIRGDLRLSFMACRVGDFTFDGVAPAYYDIELEEVGLDPDMTYIDHLEDEDGTLEYPILWDFADSTNILITLESGDTLVVEWQPLELTLRLRGTNGALVCEVNLGGLDCVPP